VEEGNKDETKEHDTVYEMKIMNARGKEDFTQKRIKEVKE
jgi:hypothetical protein